MYTHLKSIYFLVYKNPLMFVDIMGVWEWLSKYNTLSARMEQIFMIISVAFFFVYWGFSVPGSSALFHLTNFQVFLLWCVCVYVYLFKRKSIMLIIYLQFRSIYNYNECASCSGLLKKNNLFYSYLVLGFVLCVVVKSIVAKTDRITYMQFEEYIY